MSTDRSLEIGALRASYVGGGLTPSALIGALWNKIEAHPDRAIWIHRLPLSELLGHAARVEARGPAAQPLYGIPFVIKDNLDLAGSPTTAGCPEFSSLPTVSAPAVQRLMEAGAIPLGKTNLDQFATGLVGVRSPYGVPRNPFRADTIPGGSSSGSAVAVAEGLASFSLGTDTAGSGRIPAGLNNLVGLKPTRGALSSRGMIPACRTLDCISVFALTCADAAEVLHCAEGFDPADGFARPRVPVPAWPAGTRVGVPASAQLDFDGDPEAGRLFAASLARIEAAGGRPVEIDFAPFRETGTLLYQGPWVAERWAALRGFHRDHAEAFFPVTRKIVEGARDLKAADAFDGFYRLADLARRCAAEWAKMDVLLVPTAPRPYCLAEVEAEPIAHNTKLGTYTNFVNLLDLSALAVPAGFRSDGLPWGVTFIAPAWSEANLLALGARWHAAVGGPLGATGRPLPGSSTPPAAALPPVSGNLVRLAVVGAHLSGLPLNSQLRERDSRLVWSGSTAPCYRFYALPGTQPPKPGLVRVAEGGANVALEVWEMPVAHFGSFVAGIPAPLGIGTVELENGESVKGFLCEPYAIAGAEDITAFGGWRAFLASRQTRS